LIMGKSPLVSVIVPTRNSEESLRDCLQSIKNQTYRKTELIVVDNYSTDRTEDIAREFGAQVHIKGPERSAQMNLGGQIARGEYVYFINSDFVLTPELIEECVGLANVGYKAVIVWNVSDPTRSVWARTRYYERLSYYGSGSYEAARFLRRDVFLRIGGFDEEIFANEDIALARKLQAFEIASGRTKHNYELHVGEPKTLREIIVKSYYYGSNFRNFLSKYRSYGSALPIRPTFFKKEFVKKMWKEWPLGFILIPCVKLVQWFLSLLGYLAKSAPSPYQR
jgi:glycosyltransferase involved in cell wall biosynthesis